MRTDRLSEWFVPGGGPITWRAAIGLLFPPYTGMVLSFTLLGGMLADTVAWDRVIALLVIYLLGLGVAAHALDALGTGDGPKPWGEHFSPQQLRVAAGLSLLLAYGIALYYILRHVPWLLIPALIEGFFVFAYNLELFDGRFHTNRWFVLSWGAVPVLAGYVMQTNSLSLGSLLVASAAAALSLVQITASRPYKALKRLDHPTPEDEALAARYETILRCVSLGVIALGLGLALVRLGA